MNSKETDKILPALAAAIAAMPDPKKNAKNPHFKNRYADLGEVLDCIREPLADNGLLMTQHCTVLSNAVGAEGPTSLLTRIWHIESGQYIDSAVPLVMDKQTAQAQGSAITYARRYAIKALFGMNDVDDDGEGASSARRQRQDDNPNQWVAGRRLTPPPPSRQMTPDLAAKLIRSAQDQASLDDIGNEIREADLLPDEKKALGVLWREQQAKLKKQED